MSLSYLAFQVARDQVDGYSLVNKFGRNSDIDITSDPEDVWEGGGLYTGQPTHATAAETVEVVSSDINDTSAGTGARTVELSGLDANWAEQTVTVTMNGTTTVTTTETWKRLNRLAVLTAGSGGENAGTLTVTGTTTSNVYAAVPAGLNQSQVAAYTIPAGKSGVLITLDIAMARASGAAGSAQAVLVRRSDGGVYNTIRNYEITGEHGSDPLGAPLVFAAKDDLIVRIRSVSDNDTIVTASFDIVLIDL